MAGWGGIPQEPLKISIDPSPSVWDDWTAILGVLAALLTFAAAVIGLRLRRKRRR